MPYTRRIPASSTLNAWFPVRSEHPIFGDTDLTPYTVEVAITLADPEAGDWKPAVWEPTTEEINGEQFYLARLKIGPVGGAVTLTGDETYQVHVRVTTAGEAPVVPAGYLQAS